MTIGDNAWIPSTRTVPEAIAWWAAATPDAPALLDIEGNAVSYGQLQTRMDLFARRLAGIGVGRGDPVVLALPDGVTAAVAGLATLRLAIAVPVNPEQALAEVEPVLAAIAPRVVIVAQGMATAFHDAAVHAGIPVIVLDAAGALVPERAVTTDLAETVSLPSPGDLALVLLTSGTTDVPRRVPATHAALLATCSERAWVRRLTPRDRGLSSAPAYFVLGLARIIESLISGGCALVATAAEIVRRPEAVRDLGPTWVWLSPALLEVLLTAAADIPAFQAWPLRFIRAGGAQVTPSLIARAEALWGVPLLNGYGTTETLGYIAAEESPETIPRKLGSVGLPRPGLRIVIRDPAGKPVPNGTAGEITVRGFSVFPGYLNDAAATAAAFFPGGWYRTGDSGYRDDEGYLFVTGRVREMINRGGEKIAPDGIDDVLRAHPAVADAAVFAVPDARLGEEVAAAVVPRAGATVSAREVRRWAARRLAPHQVPRRIWIVAELPRTGSGKVQRGELRQLWQEKQQ